MEDGKKEEKKYYFEILLFLFVSHAWNAGEHPPKEGGLQTSLDTPPKKVLDTPLQKGLQRVAKQCRTSSPNYPPNPLQTGLERGSPNTL